MDGGETELILGVLLLLGVLGFITHLSNSILQRNQEWKQPT